MAVLSSTLARAFGNIRRLSIPCQNVNNFILQTNGLVHQFGPRTLYTPSALGIDGYSRMRDRIKLQFSNVVDKFRGKMTEFLDSETQNMIFTEDLKNMLYLAENNDADIDLIVKMTKRFNNQSKELRFGQFIFGPVVMRMFHYHNAAEKAFQAFKDPELNGFFDQIMSFQILMDLLYKNELYNELLEVFDIVQEKKIGGHRFPKNCLVLYFAACYKLNTKESYELAASILDTAAEVGHVPLRKGLTFATALAINQGNPIVALEILASLREQNYVTIRNLKVSAYADIGRPEDALPILRDVISTDVPLAQKRSVCQEVLDKVRAALSRRGNKDLAFEFDRIETALRENQQIDPMTLDAILCKDVEKRPSLLASQRMEFQGKFGGPRSPLAGQGRFSELGGRGQRFQSDRYGSTSQSQFDRSGMASNY